MRIISFGLSDSLPHEWLLSDRIRVIKHASAATGMHATKSEVLMVIEAATSRPILPQM